MAGQHAEVAVLAPESATSATCSRTSSRSGVATSSSNVSAIRVYAAAFFSCFGALQHVLDGALHVERLLGNVVVLAFHDLLEAADGVRHLHVLALAGR